MEVGNYASVATACEELAVAAVEEDQNIGTDALRCSGQADASLIGSKTAIYTVEIAQDSSPLLLHSGRRLRMFIQWSETQCCPVCGVTLHAQADDAPLHQRTGRYLQPREVY